MTGRDNVLARRLAAQMLSPRVASTPVDVVRRLLAVQAQDERGFRLAIRSRSVGSTAAEVDRALGDGSVVVTWLNRGTLHLVTAEDYRWLHPLLAPRMVTQNTLRLRQEGVNPTQTERGVEIIATATDRRGPQSRAQLRARLVAADVPVAGQALYHLLVEASIRGHVVRGPMVNGDHAFVSVGQWIGEPMDPAPTEAEVLARLGARYLAGHAPAEPTDLAKWAGIPLAAARTALASAPVPDYPVGAPPEPRLLGPFDPLVHGWASRELIVGDHADAVTSNGIFRPIVLVDGRVVGTWKLVEGVITIRVRSRVSRRAEAGVRREADDVLRFLGLPPRPPQLDAP